jgi:adenylate kinase family enzyme
MSNIKQKVIFIRGVPGSGKTILAKEIKKNNENFEHIEGCPVQDTKRFTAMHTER